MLSLDIPGFGPVRLRYVVTDFTGTLSVDGVLLPGVGDRLRRLAAEVDMEIHVLTADTFGTVREQVAGIPCTLHLLQGSDHDVQKEVYVCELGAEQVFALGNGNNDRRMLAAAKVGVAVLEGEGGAGAAVHNADLVVRSACSALDLLLVPLRLKATLRF